MWPLIKILIVTTIVQHVKLEDDTLSSLENLETLPRPSALASAERSSLDEEQYNVSISILMCLILTSCLSDGLLLVKASVLAASPPGALLPRHGQPGPSTSTSQSGLPGQPGQS